MDRWFMTATSLDDSMFWMTEINGHFMKMDLKTNHVEYLRPMCDVKLDFFRASALCVINRVVYFLANRGEFLIKLFIDKNCCDVIPINCEIMQLDIYANIFIDHEELLIFPIFNENYVRIDLKTNRVTKENMRNFLGTNRNIDMQETERILAKNDQYFFDKAYILFSNSRELFVLNRGKTARLITILPDCVGNPVEFEIYENCLYILNSQNAIYKYGNGICEKICNMTGNEYGCVHVTNDILWVFPAYAEDIYKVSLINGKAEKFTNFPKDYQYTAPNNMGKFSYKCRIGGKTYLAMHAGNYIFSIDDATGEGNVEQIIWPSIQEDICEMKYQKRSMLQEVKEALELRDYLYYIEGRP